MSQTRYSVSTKGSRTVVRRDSKSSNFPIVKGTYSRHDEDDRRPISAPRDKPPRQSKKKRSA